MQKRTTVYVQVPHEDDMYEFAMRGLQIMFINLYEGGRNQPQRIAWDDVPESVKLNLFQQYGE